MSAHHRTIGRAAGALGMLAGCGLALAAGAALEARSPVHRVVTVPGGDGPSLRILHISDVHMWRGSRWEVEWLASLADTDPDLVFLTGDNLCEPQGLTPLMEGLRPLAGLPGAFVFGSNDYFSGTFSCPLRYLGPAGLNVVRRLLGRTTPRGHLDAKPRKLRRTVPDLPHEELARFLRETIGWADLRNEAACVRVTPSPLAQEAGCPVRPLEVSLVGVDDPHISYDAEPSPGEHWCDADLRIGVTHAPYARVVDAFATLGADLVLAGHTHGGQVCLPVGRALVNNCDAPLSASGGLTDWEVGCVADPKPFSYRGHLRDLPVRTLGARVWLHVSRGLGTSKFVPLRLFCRPETTTLRIAPVQRRDA